MPPNLDTDIPAGNGIVERIDGRDVHLRPDLRDTEGHWFYWHVRLRGAAGQSLRFLFDKVALTARGPAVSFDGGWTWRWHGHRLDEAEGEGFTLEVPADADELHLSLGMVYTQRNLDAWLAGHGDAIACTALCRSPSGRPVPLLRAAAPAERATARVLLTARHHACEMMANHVLEGLFDHVLAGGGEGAQWLAEHAEVLAVPFVDHDGVERGDQGKNRRPHDHNRDYIAGRYPEVRAIRELVQGGPQTRATFALDLHCPYVRGGRHNEKVYQVGGPDAARWQAQQAFAEVLERTVRGPLPYAATNDLPFGENWNILPADQLTTCGRWIGAQAGVVFASSLEVPYAEAQGVEVTADACRRLGADLADAIGRYLHEQFG
jgi:hypothetical protein